jgi:hypothetical protein
MLLLLFLQESGGLLGGNRAVSGQLTECGESATAAGAIAVGMKGTARQHSMHLSFCL